MCGINFILSKKQPLNKVAIEQMMLSTAHRGPDYSNYIQINSHTSIAHNRLSVIDLSANANQPFVLENRYYLSFNGVIYNYKTLRKSLENEDIKFTTNSDTEVLTQLLITKGEKGIALLKGMFAFVFFDNQTHSLIAARDSYGIKPLFYFESEEYLIFSSETRGIIASRCHQPTVNKNGINDYLNFKYTTENTTIYNRLYSLNPNELFIYSEATSTRSSFQQEKLFFNTNSIPQLKSTIEAGILASLTSDVPLGLLLSGGVDSMLIYTTIKKYSTEKITCFYINADNDAEEQQQLEKLTQHHHDELIQVDYLVDFEQNLLSYISHLDHPIADSGGFLTWLLTKTAQEKNIKVVLSGAGGDELFCGYNRHFAFHQYLKLKSLIPFKLINWLPTTFLFPKKGNRLITKLLSDVSSNKTETWSNFIRLSLPLKNHVQLTDKIDTLDKAMVHDQTNYMIKDVLSITDLASMAHGVEVRVPFLYNQNTINSATLLKKGKKWILKELLTQSTRSKKGFGIYLNEQLLNTPIIASILVELKNPVHYIYTYLNYTETQQLIQQHQNKKNNYSPELWALIILICWLNTHCLFA